MSAESDQQDIPDQVRPNGISGRTRAFSAVITPRRRSLGPTRRRLIQLAWLSTDIAVMAAAIVMACLILGRCPSQTAHYLLFAGMIVVRLAVFIRSGMYRAVLRYSGIHTQVCATIGITIGSLFAISAAAFLYWDGNAELGRAFWVLEALLSLMFCGGTRLAGRMVLERFGNNGGQRVLVYGAGSLGELVLRNLSRTPGYKAVGLLDDDPRLCNAIIHGKTVHGDLSRFAAIADRTRAELVIVAISELAPGVAQRLFRICMERGIRVMVAKGVISAFDQDGKTGLGLRDMAFEDLLRRPSRNLDRAPVEQMLRGRTVLVTGAGGSIGSELCRQIVAAGAAGLVLVDHSEYNLFEIDRQLRREHPQLACIPVLEDLSDRERLERILRRHAPSIVFHAAAYKHVPMLEGNPCEGLRNNIGGFYNLLAAADACGVERLIQISTDKAVRPTNVMGASKRVCELLLQSHPTRRTKLCAVRFGNVLGSSGSVVPTFLDQIASGGPVTVTHPEVTRYFMLIPEAVALVLQAGAMADHGEIFILDMGEPVKIVDMARQLIFMTGHRPDEDIAIEYVGLRPGEKLYEELLINDSAGSTRIEGITIAAPKIEPYRQLAAIIEHLLDGCAAGETRDVLADLRRLVPEWRIRGEEAGEPARIVPLAARGDRQTTSQRIARSARSARSDEGDRQTSSQRIASSA